MIEKIIISLLIIGIYAAGYIAGYTNGLPNELDNGCIVYDKTVYCIEVKE